MADIDKLKKKLRAQAAEANESLWAIELDERLKGNQPKLGKAYKRRNNYSCPKKPSDYWWDYALVTSLSEDGLLWAKSFCIDSNGQITIEPKRMIYHAQDWTPIPKPEFTKAWKAARKNLEALMTA